MTKTYYDAAIAIIVVATLTIRFVYDGRKGTRPWMGDTQMCTEIVMLFGYVFVIFEICGPVFPMNLSASADTVVRTSGIILGLLAAVLMTWPRVMPIRNKTWSAPATEPERVPHHQLVTRGPYRFVRHPFYIGLMIGLLAIELSVASYLWLLFPLVFVWAAIRVRKEEDQLQATYGEKYREYKARTWYFIPPLY